MPDEHFSPDPEWRAETNYYDPPIEFIDDEPYYDEDEDWFDDDGDGLNDDDNEYPNSPDDDENDEDFYGDEIYDFGLDLVQGV